MARQADQNRELIPPRLENSQLRGSHFFALSEVDPGMESEGNGVDNPLNQEVINGEEDIAPLVEPNPVVLPQAVRGRIQMGEGNGPKIVANAQNATVQATQLDAARLAQRSIRSMAHNGNRPISTRSTQSHQNFEGALPLEASTSRHSLPPVSRMTGLEGSNTGRQCWPDSHLGPRDGYELTSCCCGLDNPPAHVLILETILVLLPRVELILPQ